MDVQEQQFNEKESLALIATMINKAKDSYYDTGIACIMWGSVIAICSLIKFSELQFGFRLPFDIYLLTLVAIIPQIIISIRENKSRKVKSYDDAFVGYLWLGFGITIFLMIFIINNIAADLQPLQKSYNALAEGRDGWIDFRFSEFVSPLMLLLYGLPTFITGASFNFKPMLWGGIFCWVFCIVTIYTPVKIDLLLTGLSAVMAWLVPGLMMRKAYRMYKRGEMSPDV